MKRFDFFKDNRFQRGDGAKNCTMIFESEEFHNLL